MDDTEKIRERVRVFQRLRELTAERFEQETVNYQRAWKLLEEKHRATIARLLASKMAITSRTS